MKKILTFITLLLAMTTNGMAQQVDGTFQFIDEHGNVVPDGSVITVSDINAEGQMVVPLWVKNTSGQKAAVSMYENIDAKPIAYAMDEGELELDDDGNPIPLPNWQTCAFGNCMNLKQTGYSAKSIVSGDYNASIQTEWQPEEGKYDSWTATLQIHVFDIKTKTVFGQTTEVAGDEIIGYGPKVTVNFFYNSESASIRNLQEGQREVARYSLTGRRLNAPSRGINIVRLANGKAVKKIVR